MNNRMSENQPLVSIILCTFNRENLLPFAVRSVLAQSYFRWELIVIDDGSSDRTKEVMRGFRQKDKRIQYHFQTNQGLAAARNAGLKRARGTFICFVDSDDELMPRHLEHRVRYMTGHPGVDLIHGGMKLIGPKRKQYVVDMTDPTKKIHLDRCHIGGTFFFRRSILASVGGFSPVPFGEDFDFYRRVHRQYSVRKVRWKTYVYHLDSENRLCDIFTDKLLIRSTQKTLTQRTKG